MKDSTPRLMVYLITGFICCKCETCGWSAKTAYVNGETTDQTVRRAFGHHSCHISKNRVVESDLVLQAGVTG